MSPTFYAVQTARLERDLEAARRAGDMPRMQETLRGKMSLMRAMHGTLA
jgi:hypothetical protein